MGLEFKSSPPACAVAPGTTTRSQGVPVTREHWLGGSPRSGSFCGLFFPALTTRADRGAGGSVVVVAEEEGPAVRGGGGGKGHPNSRHPPPAVHPAAYHLPHHRCPGQPPPHPAQQHLPGPASPSADRLPSLSSGSVSHHSHHSLRASTAAGPRLRPVSATAREDAGALVVRGRSLQRAAAPHHENVPLPEPADEDLPPDYVASVLDAVTSYNTTPTGSGRSSPSNVETQSTLSFYQGGWTTGGNTDRSSRDSSYSLDEFDRQAASTVNRKFEEFESMLFEGPRDPQSATFKECQEWLNHFKHLRVLGKQVMAPMDTGFEFVTTAVPVSETTPPRPSTSNTSELHLMDHDLSYISDTQGLLLSGRKVKASHVPVLEVTGVRDGHTGTRPTRSEYDFLHEEVFAQDGIYEEIIAVDYKSLYEENMEHKQQITPRRRRVGYPPITPNACAKDSVSSGVFDSMWCEIMSWMRILLRRYAQELESKKDGGNHALVPQPLYSRTSSFVLPVRSTLPMDSQMTFDGMLNVSRMPLQNRSTALSMSAAEVSEPGVLAMNHPAMSPVQRMNPNRPSTTVNRWRHGRPGKLDPLPEPSKVVQNSEEGRSYPSSPQYALRVNKIVPVGSGPHRLSSPPNPNGGRLPPLEASPGAHSRGKLGHRASSAIDNKEGRIVARERSNNAIEVGRPSTTQAFRSETPLNNRRSSTPLGQSSRLFVMNHSKGGLGIMGSSLHPSSDPAPNILEDNEGPPMEDVRHNQWIPSTPSYTSNFLKRQRILRNTPF